MFRLREVTTEKDTNFVRKLMFSEPGIKEIFLNNEYRAAIAHHIFIIEVDKIDIGFIYATSELLDNFLFIDIGIKKKYRGYHYSVLAVEKLVEFYDTHYPYERIYLIAETKISNIKANLSASLVGKNIYDKDDKIFYLMNVNLYEDLVNTDNYSLLVNHIEQHSKLK